MVHHKDGDSIDAAPGRGAAIDQSVPKLADSEHAALLAAGTKE